MGTYGSGNRSPTQKFFYMNLKLKTRTMNILCGSRTLNRVSMLMKSFNIMIDKTSVRIRLLPHFDRRKDAMFSKWTEITRVWCNHGPIKEIRYDFDRLSKFVFKRFCYVIKKLSLLILLKLVGWGDGDKQFLRGG